MKHPMVGTRNSIAIICRVVVIAETRKKDLALLNAAHSTTLVEQFDNRY